MARGLGNVVDAYLGPCARATPALRLLVLLQRDAWVASSVAVRLIQAVSARGSGTSIEAVDPLARALVGLAALRARRGPVRLEVEFASTAPSVPPDCVLSVLPISSGNSRWGAFGTRLGGAEAAATIGLVDTATGCSGVSSCLATIPEREAIRTALGVRPCEALDRAALALERWLQAQGFRV